MCVIRVGGLQEQCPYEHGGQLEDGGVLGAYVGPEAAGGIALRQHKGGPGHDRAGQCDQLEIGVAGRHGGEDPVVLAQ